LPIRVSASEYERAIRALTDEFHEYTSDMAKTARVRALEDVVSWRWSRFGAPGIGDVEADLRIGGRAHWLEKPPPDDNDHHGLDSQGRVRITRRRIQANDVVIEYETDRIRNLVIADESVVGIEDVLLENGRYATSLGTNADGWTFNTFEYDGDRLVSVWTVMHHTGNAASTVMTRTARYELRGRFRELHATLDDAPSTPARGKIVIAT
jgi:hypothetical protein